MEHKIPKIIHYCWFGDKDKPESVLHFINNWKEKLPDYEIREWNNLDLEKTDCIFAKQAAQCKKWAFVADYFRLYALYNFGGIYLDTDVEVFKDFEPFLDLEFFGGFEEYKGAVNLLTAVLGATNGNDIIGGLLKEYESISFIDEYNEEDLTTINKRLENYLVKITSLKRPFNKSKQVELKKDCILFPCDYFCTYNQKVSFATTYYNDSSWLPICLAYKRKFITKNLFYRIYTIKNGQFWNGIKDVKELPIFAYPRIGKRSVVVSIGKR